jgi:hypothetical protein
MLLPTSSQACSRGTTRGNPRLERNESARRVLLVCLAFHRSRIVLRQTRFCQETYEDLIVAVIGRNRKVRPQTQPSAWIAMSTNAFTA